MILYKVAAVPGSAFGDSGEGYMRISYAYSLSNLKEALDRIEDFEEINLQDKVFRHYYGELDDEIKNELSLEDFENAYQNSEYQITEFVEKLNKKDLHISGPSIRKAATLSQYWYQEYEDLDFIISDNHNGHNNNPNYTPLPVYASYEKNRSFDLSSSRDFTFDRVHNPELPEYDAGISAYYSYFLREGDIVWDCASFISQDPTNLITHAGLIVNMNKDGVYWDASNNPTYFQFIETIESVASGVRFGYLDDNRILRNGTRVLRSTVATPEQVDTAIDFMFSQLGKDYNLDISYSGPVPGSTRNSWYCTQLVFSAFYSAGVNLCENWYHNNYYGYGGTVSGPVTGSMFYHSMTVEEIGFYTMNKPFPTLSVSNKSGSTWKIDITNTFGYPICVSYTPSMYFWGDIINDFTNKTLADIYLASYETRTVNVTENGLATSILAYVIVDGEACVTIANELSNSPKSLFEVNYVKSFSGVHYQFGRDSESNYQLQISNSSGSSISYRTSGNILRSNGEVDKFCFKEDFTNYSFTVYNGDTYFQKVNANSEKYFAIRKANTGSGQNQVINMIKFEVNKTTNKVTVTEKTSDVKAIFLRLSIIKKSGTKWTIRVRNLYNSGQYFYYNTKMCNYNDAKNWTGLSNVPSNPIYISSNGYKDVEISENWFATSITFRVDLNGKKYISYADGLNASTKSLNFYTNIK